MPADIAVSAQHLGKSYLVGHNAKIDSHETLREQMARSFRDLSRKTRDMVAGRQIVQGDTVEEFWAVRDVSFEVPRGARLGIVGRNGAGKSTLLKLLSRITEPTQGRIAINGRVASLLEVGTGFHPELTGRENVYLNGAILGMSRREIQKKFDEIVEFSEVERFLDTPVKRYSSGMYMRLAFAVAAHLEPEILIVDEVLAVGDAEFQKKCLGKMKEVGSGGRTVIFVSHNVAAVTQLCDIALHMRAGQLVDFGPSESVIASYIGDSAVGAGYRQWDNTDRDDVALLSIELLDTAGVRRTEFAVDEAFFIKMTIEVLRPQADGRVGFRIGTGDGTPVFSSEDVDAMGVAIAATAGIHEMVVEIPADYLNDGSYTITAAGHIPNLRWLFMKTEVIHFQLHGNDPIGAKRLGYVRPKLAWNTARVSGR